MLADRATVRHVECSCQAGRVEDVATPEWINNVNIKMSESKLPCFSCPRHFPKANRADVVVCTKLGFGHRWESEGVESESHTNIKYNDNIVVSL